MDELQFEQECEQRRHALMAYAYTCCGDVHVAEDIVQDTLLIACQKRERYFPESDFGAWLIAICRNVWFKERDKRMVRNRHRPFIQEHAAQIFSEQNYHDDKWEAEEQALNHCLEKLSDVDRDLINRHFQTNQKYQQIADVFGKSLSWVKVRMHRSRKALLECVQRNVGSELSASEQKHGP